MRSLLLVESFDLCPSNQYILVRVIPSCFRLCQVSLLSRCSPRYLTSSSWWDLYVIYMYQGPCFPSCVNVMWTDLDPWAFILLFSNQFWIAASLVCSLCEAMAGSLYVAATAILLANVTLVDCGEVGRSEVYSRYNRGPRTLPCDMPTLTGLMCWNPFNIVLQRVRQNSHLRQWHSPASEET
jgi:hypothetical protein